MFLRQHRLQRSFRNADPRTFCDCIVDSTVPGGGRSFDTPSRARFPSKPVISLIKSENYTAKSKRFPRVKRVDTTRFHSETNGIAYTV